MNSLPDELIINIFNYLDIDFLIINCKLVCKRFCKLVDKIRPEELVIRRIFSQYQDINWSFQPYQPIKLSNILFVHDEFSLFDHPLFKNNLVNLKKFKIDKIIELMDLNMLNKLFNLEQIEIDHEFFTLKNCILELKNLKRAKIRIKNCGLFINSSNLENLICYQSDKIGIIDYQLIKYLELDRGFDDGLKRYKNLEIIKIRKLIKSTIDLRPFKNLKEIYLDHFHKCFNESIELILNSILNQKSSYKENNFKLLFKGIEIIDTKSIAFNRIDERYKEYLNYYYDNQLININENYYFNSIDYTDLIVKFGYDLPLNLFKNLVNIQEVIIMDTLNTINQNHFINFLSNCSLISSLSILNSSLNQKFFDLLPKICPLTQKLNLFANEMKLFNLNYNFIFKCKILNYFNTNDMLSLTKFSLDILTKNKFTKEFSFVDNFMGDQYHGLTVIKKYEKNRYSLQYKSKIWYAIDFNQLIELLINLEQNKGKSNLYSKKLIVLHNGSLFHGI